MLGEGNVSLRWASITQEEVPGRRVFPFQVDVASLVFRHHHLFSLEHYMTRRLMELYHEYTERLRNNAVTGILFKIVNNEIFLYIQVRQICKKKIRFKVISRKLVIAHERRRYVSYKRHEKKAHPCQLIVLGSI